MSIIDWIATEHPFFKQVRNHVVETLSFRQIKNIDELVVIARYPVRTVLLVLDHLLREGVVKIRPEAWHTSIHNETVPTELYPAPILTSKDIVEKYKAITSKRNNPALLWGQRWLVPHSAVMRAEYIVKQADSYHGKITFLGDDDLVSPLVAHKLPHWDVKVIDIDKDVLEQVSTTAQELNCTIHTKQVDVSQETLEFTDIDIVVCDPFPSGDGSFEAMFWLSSWDILKVKGKLITTVAPSHKPLEYSAGAIQQLKKTGFLITDLQADYGHYEVFPFEFTPIEQSIIQNYGFHPRIAHTKSLITAVKLPSTARNTISAFDFVKWNEAARKHYLTIQAGVEQQVNIVKTRGLAPHQQLDNTMVNTKENRALELLLPKRYRKEARNLTLQEITQLLSKSMNSNLSSADIELLNLVYSEPQTNTPSINQLRLYLRALESWERWKLDGII